MPEKLEVSFDAITPMHSIPLGNSTFVLGVIKATEQTHPMYAVAELVIEPKTGSMFMRDAVADADYLRMTHDFAKRIQVEAMKLHKERHAHGFPFEMVAHHHCNPATNYTGKVVAVRADLLRPEQRSADQQLVYVHVDKGGMVTGRRLSTNESVKRPRSDFWGVVAPAFMPQWAKPYHKAAMDIHKTISQHTNAIMGAIGLKPRKTEYVR